MLVLIMLDVEFRRSFNFHVYYKYGCGILISMFTIPMDDFTHRHHKALASLWGTHKESVDCSSMHSLHVDVLLVTC